MREINIGFKDERIRLLFLHAPFKRAGQPDVQRLAAVRALALDLDHKWFVT